jgi:gp16 family phage-associated protein
LKSTDHIEINLIKVQDFTPDDLRRAKNAFYARGERISEWALTHGFSTAMVYSVLNGRSQGRHGQAHLIAVALGLKAPPGTGTRKEPQR